jgi:signal transduction histidine kinase
MIALAVLAMIGMQFNAFATSNGSADEARALIDKAVKLVATDGNEKAYTAFNDAAGGYVDRDLYIFVMDLQGTVLAHGANKSLIGKQLLNLKDANGKTFVQEMVAVASAKGEGWVDYHWSNPVTKKVEGKSTLVKKVGDVFVAVGIYKG